MAVYENPNDARRQSFLVYMSGVEVPAVSVSVTSGVWQFPEASISVAPDKTLARLGREDKVQVAIFYLDTHYEATPAFRLLFDGEITGWAYRSHASGSRVMEFKAIGHGAILTQLFPFFMTNLDSIASGATNTGTVGKAFTEYANTLSSNLLTEGLRTGDRKKLIKRPYDFVENIFTALYGKTDTYVNGSVTQYFFGKWARLTGFHNKWVPSPYIEHEDLVTPERPGASQDGIFPILRAQQSDAILAAMSGVIQRLGDSGSFWDLLRVLFGLMQYEVAINPAPPAVSLDLDTGRILGPPNLGVTALEEISNLRQQRDDLSDKIHDSITAGSLVDSDLYEQLDQVDRELSQLVELTSGTIREGIPPKDPKKPTRLASFVTKPILPFTVPPMCNVLYPSMLQSYGFSENYATTPSRIYVADKSILEIFKQQSNPLTAKHEEANTYAYPPIVKEFLDRKHVNANLSGYNLLVWPDEFFKGPVILTHTAPQWFFSIAAAYAKSGNSAVDYYAEVFEDTVFNLYAETEFHREKYGQRYGTVETLFNPYVVAGYPGVVFDNLDVGLHTTMNITQVTHNLTQSTANTSVSYTFAQSFDEFFELFAREVNVDPRSGRYASLEKYKELISKRDAIDTLVKESIDSGFRDDDLVEAQEIIDRQVDLFEEASSVDVSAVPAHPLPDIRYRFQNAARAEEYYETLFHRIPSDAGAQVRLSRDASFDIPFRVGVSIDGATAVDMTTAAKLFDGDGVETLSYQLSDEDRGYANSADAAMRAVARPVCTLEEYIDFLGDRGRRNPGDRVEPNDPVLGKGAVYYVEIAGYAEGPGEEPSKDEQGYYVAAPTADTRAPWSTRLREYRAKVLESLAPHKV